LGRTPGPLAVPAVRGVDEDVEADDVVGGYAAEGGGGGAAGEERGDRRRHLHRKEATKFFMAALAAISTLKGAFCK
jgi:hypothetical protein